MGKPQSALEGPDLVARLSGIGAGAGAILGGIVGLVIGLVVYPPTAWFAMIEVGAPAAILGGIGGLVTSLVIKRHQAAALPEIGTGPGNWPGAPDHRNP